MSRLIVRVVVAVGCLVSVGVAQRPAPDSPVAKTVEALRAMIESPEADAQLAARWLSSERSEQLDRQLEEVRAITAGHEAAEIDVSPDGVALQYELPTGGVTVRFDCTLGTPGSVRQIHLERKGEARSRCWIGTMWKRSWKSMPLRASGIRAAVAGWQAGAGTQLWACQSCEGDTD